MREAVALNPQASVELKEWILSNTTPAGATGTSDTVPTSTTSPVPAPPQSEPGVDGSAAAELPAQPKSSYAAPAQPDQAFQTVVAADQLGAYAESTPGNLQYSAENEPATKKSAKKWILIGLIAALIIAGVAIALNAFVFSKLSGSKTPEAAVTKLFESLEKQDMVAVYGSVTPSEIDLAQDSYAQFSKHFEGDPLGQNPQDFLVDALKAYS